jgi:hypothetical protein
MDLFDLSAKRQSPTTEDEAYKKPTAFGDNATEEAGSTQDASWTSIAAQEIWSGRTPVVAPVEATQTVATTAQSDDPPAVPADQETRSERAGETFDATPPNPAPVDPLLLTTDKPAPVQPAKALETPAPNRPAEAPPATDSLAPPPTDSLAPAATAPPAPASTEPLTPARSGRPIDLQKSLQWLEKSVEISDKTDTRAAVSRIVEGQAASLNLVETLTQPGLSADRRKVLADMNLLLHGEKWQEYMKYLDPALSRAELALAKITSGDDKQIAEGEKNLVAAVALRPELQVDAAFQRKVLTAYHQMETSRKNKGLPPWTGELKPESAAASGTTGAAGTTGATKEMDDALDKANTAYFDKGIKEALPHFEAAIKASDKLPQDALTKELTELFCKRLTLERAIIAGELREQNVDKLVADHKTAKENEWTKYQEYVSPGATRVNTALAMISSGDPDMLKRAKTILGEAIARRPELEFSADYQQHLKKAFESHHKNKPPVPGQNPAAQPVPAAPENPRPAPEQRPTGAPGQTPGDQRPTGAPGQTPGDQRQNPEAPKPGQDRQNSPANPNSPNQKFEVGYKKFETKDLGKAATDLEKDTVVQSYLADSVTGPALTVAVIYLGYRVAKGRIEAVRARRAAAAEAKANAATEVKPGEVKVSEGDPKPAEPKPAESKPAEAKTAGTTGDTKPGTAKPETPGSTDSTSKPPAQTDAAPAAAKPASAETDAAPAEVKPAAAETDKLPLSERINTASEDIRPGLKKLLQMANKPENKGKDYRRLVNELIELDKAGKIDGDMRFYLKKGGTSFLKDGGAEHLQELVDKASPKRASTPAPTERPPISNQQRTQATDAAFDAAKQDIAKYEQTGMTRQAKEFTNDILSKYFPGVEATEVFAGSEGLAVRLNDGTILKFRPNTEWDSSWGFRDLDMPLLSIDGNEPRPMLVGKEGKQWVVYRQPFGETPDAKRVQEFLKTVTKAQGDTGDLGRAVDSASRQLGEYKNPVTGKTEVRCFDYAAIDVELSGDHDFREEDVLDLKKPSTEGPRPETSKPEGPKPEGPKPEGPRPEGPKPEGPKPESPRPEGPKPEGPKPEGPKPPVGGNANPTAPRTTGSAPLDEIPLETSPFERGAQGEPVVERPGAAMEAAKMIEIKLPGGIVARMAKADAPAFLDKVERDFKTTDFGKVLDEMISDKTRPEEEKTELRNMKERYEALPADMKEECKAEFFAQIRSQLGLKTETTETERSRSGRVGRALVIGGGILGVGILSTAVLRHCLQKEVGQKTNRVQVEFINKPAK